MRDVLDDDIAELYPARGTDDVRLARLREQLFKEPPPRKSRRWVGVAAAAAAVVLIAGLVVTLRPAWRDAPATLPTRPATSLPEAAVLLETEPKPTAKYQHITYRLAQALSGPQIGESEYGSMMADFEIDVWLPTSPGESVFIFRRDTGGRRALEGRPWPENKVIERGLIPRLWESLCMASPCAEDTVPLPLPADALGKLTAAQTPMVSPFTTNEQKAALYRKLAESPEITWNNGVVTAEGGSVRYTVDPATGRLAGMVVLEPRHVKMPADLAPRTVTITYEWTDQRPS
ncbi:hypothetical protein JNUCC0626_18830 [Lentzea sp. JNUCC 0626]|uniref:hypothetical protein n=1 Tax=Lentzea sp. JNUCC 0626 TaxID=3367513 RepID=UPI003749C126